MFSFIKNIVFFSASGKSFSNSKLIILHAVKKYPKRYQRFPFSYFRQNFEWEFTWYVVTKWSSSGFSSISRAKAFTIESIICLYSSTLSLVNIGAS